MKKHFKRQINYKSFLILEYFALEQHYLSLTMSCFTLCYPNTTLQYCYLRPHLPRLLPGSLRETKPRASKNHEVPLAGHRSRARHPQTSCFCKPVQHWK